MHINIKKLERGMVDLVILFNKNKLKTSGAIPPATLQ
jgi:t-SNARE complex subunit (syntaxin)